MLDKSHEKILKKFVLCLFFLSVFFVFVGASFAVENDTTANEIYLQSVNSQIPLDYNDQSNLEGKNYTDSSIPVTSGGMQQVANQNNLSSVEDFLDLNGCCSVIIHVSDGHDVIAHRRDSSVLVNVFINDSFKIGDRDAVEQYKTYNGTKDFFHLLITTDGWMVGCGGTSGNMELEALAAEIMKYGSINYNFLDEAFMIIIIQ